MASVTLKGITKRWNEFVAVRDLSLLIEDQEFLVLLGPSGCGKTTTMRMIAGLEEPTLGEVFIGDRKVNDDLPKDRDVAMVFQNYGLYPHLTVYENIRYPLKVRKVPKSLHSEKARQAAEKPASQSARALLALNSCFYSATYSPPIVDPTRASPSIGWST